MTPEERKATPRFDYLTPCIADADAGFGGTGNVMKLVKMFVENGAAGIHIEDQKVGAKKCGHLGGKVVVSTREHLNRLQAARLQADIMGVELVIVARTDALSAAFIDSDIDPTDHPYIVGMVEGGEEMTFPEAGVYYITRQFPEGEMRDKRLQHWDERCTNLSLNQAKQFAESLGFKLEFDWDACRSYEGYFKLKGNV